MASANKKIVIGAVAAAALAAASAQVAPSTIAGIPVVAYVGVEYVPVAPDADLPDGGSVQTSIEACGATCLANAECNAMSYYEDASSLMGTDKNCWIKKLADPCAGVPAGGKLMAEVTFAIRTDSCGGATPGAFTATAMAPAPVPEAPAPVPEAPPTPAPAAPTVPTPAPAPTPMVSADPPVATPAPAPAAPVPSGDRAFTLPPADAPVPAPATPAAGPSSAPVPEETTRGGIDLEAESGAMTLRSAAIAAVVAGVAAAFA